MKKNLLEESKKYDFDFPIILNVSTANKMESVSSNSIDFVLVTHVFCSIPEDEIDNVLNEIHRILKKGGKVIFLEHVKSKDSFLFNVSFF
jgi:ubiquinone/menaquinone biosynthesis C-methylase UbiE